MKENLQVFAKMDIYKSKSFSKKEVQVKVQVNRIA